MTDARKKPSPEERRKTIRALGATPWEVTQCVMTIVAQSAKDFTFLIPTEMADEDEDDETYPDDLQDRWIGMALDNFILGILPLDDGGKLRGDAALPADMMTVGGTPIRVERSGDTIVLIDPLGTRSTVTGFLGRMPNAIGVKVDKPLMEAEWFGDEPLSRKASARRVNRFDMIQPSSVVHAIGGWQSYDFVSAQGQTLKVRSRLGEPGVLATARDQQIFRVRCTLTPDQVGPHGQPLDMVPLNKFEDFLAIRLAIAKPKPTTLAVVSRPGSYDFYYCSEDSSRVLEAIQPVPKQPFQVGLTRIVGDTSKLIGSLTPPAESP